MLGDGFLWAQPVRTDQKHGLSYCPNTPQKPRQVCPNFVMEIPMPWVPIIPSKSAICSFIRPLRPPKGTIKNDVWPLFILGGKFPSQLELLEINQKWISIYFGGEYPRSRYLEGELLQMFNPCLPPSRHGASILNRVPYRPFEILGDKKELGSVTVRWQQH